MQLLVLIYQHLCHFVIIGQSGRKCFSHTVLRKEFSYVCAAHSLCCTKKPLQAAVTSIVQSLLTVVCMLAASNTNFLLSEMLSFFVLQWLRKGDHSGIVPIQPSQWYTLGLAQNTSKPCSGNGRSLIQLSRGKMSLKLDPELVSRKQQSTKNIAY